MIAFRQHEPSAPDTAAPIRDILSLLEAAAAARNHASAIETPNGKTLTYCDLLAIVSRIGDHLLVRSGGATTNRRRFAIVLPNGDGMSIVLLAAATVGTAVPLNPAYRDDEFARYLRATKADCLVVDRDDSAAAAAARRAGIPVVIVAAADIANLGIPAAGRPLPRPRPDDVALILMTSGSTGSGKIVPLTHRNLCASAADVCRSVGLDADDRVLSMWEQFHIGGIVDLLLAPLAAGGTVIAAGSFDAARFFELLPVARPTWFQGVPTTLRELCQLAARRRLACRGTSLRFLRSVAAALPEALRHEIEDLFATPVVRTFGMTEAAPLITSTRLPPHVPRPGSVGASSGPEVRILDTEGRPLGTGVSGHVAVRGENVFQGYEADPAANAAAFVEGWFLTGDLGYLDVDGDLFLTGRAKELINRGGEKIAPQEIDEALARHPAVEQAAAFGVPHPTLGESVAAAVILRAGAAADEATLQAFAARLLADFKSPRQIIFLQQLPRCPVGKVRRRELADLAARRTPTNAHAQPTNPLEAALAELWAAELDIDAIGLDDDFAAAGGDSLSSVRLILAAEALVGMKIADQIAGRCSTVRTMARALAELGCSTTGPWPRATAAEEPGAGGDLSRKEVLLAAVAESLVGRDQLPADLLFTARSRVAFEAARHTAENVSTPAELGRLLTGRRRLAFGRISAAVLAPLTAAVIVGRRATLRRDLDRVIAGADEPLLWQRTAIAEQADLFHGPDTQTDTKTLIVGFTSRSMRLTTPTYHVLCSLDPMRHELLMLRDPLRRHYRSGVPGIGDSVTAVARWLERYAAKRRYGRVVTFGTSAGGMPAVCTAILNRWPLTLACGADRPSSHSHLAPLVAECGRRLADHGGTDVLLAYSGRNDRDAAGAAEIRGLVPGARTLPDDRFEDHALLYQLHRAGDLRSFLRTHLVCGERSSDHWQRQLTTNQESIASL
jgi:acyl-CoA synthetase (AMP-forming)/AMP-acid ligase II/acyl carrier protein